MAAPMNMQKLAKGTDLSSCKTIYRALLVPMDKISGKQIPLKLIMADRLKFCLIFSRSTSIPIRNIFMTNPMLEMVVKLSVVGKIVCVQPGMLPKTDGPRNIPPTIFLKK
jgi:hypothetical protein